MKLRLDASAKRVAGYKAVTESPQCTERRTLTRRSRVEETRAHDPLLLGIRDAAARLGVSRSALRNLIEGGHLKAVLLPSSRADGRPVRRLFVTVADLVALVNRCKQE